MLHGSTSFNFCWSTNVEHCCAVYHSNFKNKASSWKRQGNLQLMKRRYHGDSRQHGKLSPELARIYSLVVPSSAAICTRALSLKSRFLWSFDLTSYRHGKVSVDWCYQNSSRTLLLLTLQLPCSVDISRKPRDTKLENDRLKPFNKRQLEPCSIFVQQLSTCWTVYFNIHYNIARALVLSNHGQKSWTNSLCTHARAP